MRGLLVLTLACGCNQLFDVERTLLVDAPPPIDAAPPPACPTDGGVPAFKNELVNIPARNCTYYSASEMTGQASALCASEDFTSSNVGIGPIGESLVEQVLDPPMSINSYDAFALTPEADRFMISRYEHTQIGSVYRTVEYTRSDVGWTFSKSYQLDETNGYYYTISRPSGGPDRRAIAYRHDQDAGSYFVEELVDSAGTWMAKTKYTLEELDVASILDASLSSDGLRLVFLGYDSANGEKLPGNYNAVFYTSRNSLEERFLPAQKITTVPSGVGSPYLSEDCGRIYFSALGSVWYLKQ